MADDLPKDTLYHIFSRLPVKSLARFRCVSKQWCNYINDPYLVSIHVKEPLRMMLHQFGETRGIVNMIESKEGVFKVKQDPVYMYQCKTAGPIWNLSCCNGLIFLSQCFGFLVIHPLRKQLYELPFVDPKACGLGFDDSTNTFKVVCLYHRYSNPSSLCTMVYAPWFKVDVASFESLALPQLQVKEDTDLFVIDEVGKMELFSSLFFPAVLRVLESNKPLLATIPVPKPRRDIPAVERLKSHPGATIFTLTTDNRDAMKDRIYSRLIDNLE